MPSNITQKNKLEMLGKLTASLAHELRNPLSAIKLNLEYLKMESDGFDDDEKESVLNSIEGVDRIENLIENILDFSRKNRHSNKKVSINNVTASAINLSKAKASHAKVNIKHIKDENLPLIYFDKNNLLQVFLNLITNSIEAIPNGGGEIVISSCCQTAGNDRMILWQIEDNGIGIKEEDKEKIFGEFFTSKRQGTGLGLTVCRDILEENRAKLKFDSEYGKGTKFIIHFELLGEEGEDKVNEE